MKSLCVLALTMMLMTSFRCISEARNTISVVIDDDADLANAHTRHHHRQSRFQDKLHSEPSGEAHENDRATSTDLDVNDENQQSSQQDMAFSVKQNRHHGDKHHKGKMKRKFSAKQSKALARESAWYHCSDGSDPQEANLTKRSKGVMCSREYPTDTCCWHHDLSVELVGSKIVETVKESRCARFLMKLRCAHCSPRSWWLFHAPDKKRLPHKRIMPILCPAFCRKFHDACRDSIAGLQNDNFCDYHTSDEAGPCFPDYEIRRGTID